MALPTTETTTESMTLNFPNESRSFDETRKRVRFWGYDRAMEISFFVEADALQKLHPDATGNEAGLLQAFDTARQRIHEAAGKVYGRRSSHSYSYVLTASDF